ncbi:hypothetical protein Bca4012_026103 [Brassica carinata]
MTRTMKCLTMRFKEKKLQNLFLLEKKRSSSDLPPKPRKKIAHRAKCWEHFIQQEDDPAQCNCCYCGLEMGCDSKTVGTSPMINHLARCKLHMAAQESKTQTQLTGNSSGPALAVRYDPLLVEIYRIATVTVIKHVLFLIHGYVDNQSMTGGHVQNFFLEETSEIALMAWQDDRHDQVAESSLLRVETHVVDDVSDYDIAPVNPPNDEYVSDGDVEADRDSDDDSE